MNTAPLVSCIIPTKNRLDKAHDAIRSVLNQDYKNIEIIVIDDGSTPQFKLCEEFKNNPKITVIRANISVGGAKARNMGIEHSRGAFFCFLDDDDVYLPNKLSDLTKILIEKPEYDAAIGECILLDCATGIKSFTPQNNFSSKSNTSKNRVHTNSTLINSRIKNDIKFNEELEKFQDTQFNTDLCFKFNVTYTPTAIALWNINWSSNQITTKKSTFRNTKNYFRLTRHFISNSKIPLRLLYWHIYKLTSFAVRLK